MPFNTTPSIAQEINKNHIQCETSNGSNAFLKLNNETFSRHGVFCGFSDSKIVKEIQNCSSE